MPDEILEAMGPFPTYFTPDRADLSPDSIVCVSPEIVSQIRAQIEVEERTFNKKTDRHSLLLGICQLIFGFFNLLGPHAYLMGKNCLYIDGFGTQLLDIELHGVIILEDINCIYCAKVPEECFPLFQFFGGRNFLASFIQCMLGLTLATNYRERFCLATTGILWTFFGTLLFINSANGFTNFYIHQECNPLGYKFALMWLSVHEAELVFITAWLYHIIRIYRQKMKSVIITVE